MPRIAVGGFLHETNTFAPTKATYADFVHGGGWPAMTQGADVSEDDAQHQCRTCRFHRRGREPRAGSWCRRFPAAQAPRAHVTEDAFERIVKVMVDGIATAGRLDAVYLDLHGAMVTEHLDDGEGEILARVRKRDRPGPAAGRQPRPARQRVARDGRRTPMRSSPTAPIRMSTWPRPAAPRRAISRCCSTASSALPKRSGNCRS